MMQKQESYRLGCLRLVEPEWETWYKIDRSCFGHICMRRISLGNLAVPKAYPVA
ncbi:hypothetical protein HETIRDRAFT_174921 [Heterobasidion irregulare TC 32-1]|uniref:Uncharacterized protein n=1 Tax=Heterobasidion irregulare (strain TC 32-1) TaxID=747525 RepID=W4JUX3_HETIT|nr:uncharacterized protein HETIRDRAFT_174921 [Heterobasidion irregulare TC 32-1]ETW76880.1 hypothetical protein HETIRDRAFT_174921 [Heterobasidion irregulare TC 32-1]